MSDKTQIGPTGTFHYHEKPLDALDKGGLNVSLEISPDNMSVVMCFGTSVTWVASPPEEAKQIADKFR